MPAMQNERFDVVVVGAGPTGALLALELALGGARVVILERLAAIDETIKAGGMATLAGEALERRGFGAEMAAVEGEMLELMRQMARAPAGGGAPTKKIGGHFAGLMLIDQSVQREPERRLRGVNQQGLERMLHARLAAVGIPVRRGVTVRGFDDDGERVRVTTDAGPFEARWLVGCDGGRSVVRKGAGIGFEGTDPTLTGHQAIVEVDHPERLLPLGWRRTARGMVAWGPLPGRIFVAEFDGPPLDRGAPITIDEVEASVRRVTGADVRIRAMKTATRFTDHARQATTYRKGRVLLAGDAAHVHSPFGGQGLNLGLVDAQNLGWKLAGTIAGWADEALLDTYTPERHPAGARALAATRAQIALMRPDPFTTDLRAMFVDLMGMVDVNRYVGELLSGRESRYDLGDDYPLVGKLIGDRALAGGGTAFGLMTAGDALVLDAGDGGAAAIASPWTGRVRSARVEGDTSIFLRPDGCVAWARPAGATSGLEVAIGRWMGDPARQSAARRSAV